MRAMDFNHGWTCRHLDEPGTERPVTLPHDAMLAEKRDECFPGGINTGWYEGRDYLYEKRFPVSAELAGRQLVLELEGVYHNAEVLLNGEKLAFRPYGYTNFYVTLTGRLLSEKENVLQVIARNSDQPNSRWYSGAGIYRPVTLWVGGERHIPVNGVRIRTLSVTPPQVAVSVTTSCPGDVRVEVLDGPVSLRTVDATAAPLDGGVSRAEVTLSLSDIDLWSPDSPRLYTCRVTFGDDTEEETFGVRELRWGREGFTINGQRVLLQGACIHHDNGILGACCYPEAVERKVRLLQETGYNAIRSAHNPCSKALLSVCDRLGMLVMDEYIDHWYIHKTQYDYVSCFDAWWRQDLKDMVDKDFNHPCVVLYSTGNEVSETAQERGIALTGELTAYLHGLDDSRPVTCGVNIFFNFLSSIGMGVYSDEKARVEAEKAEKDRAEGKKAGKKRAVGSQFFNDLAGLLGDEFMKRGATLRACDRKTRGAFANMDIAGYNYGIYRYRGDLKRYPERLILGSETFCRDAGRFREIAREEPRLVGDFVWAGMDYLGEVGVGSWEYSDYAPAEHRVGWVSAGSGRIDLIGNPLGEALYTRVALEKEPGPLMAVCPVNHTGDKHSPSAWKMSNALPTWNWRGCEGRRARVEVYARAAAVELRLEGRTLARKRIRRDCLAVFTVPWAPGVLEAVAFDKAGREMGRCALRAAGQRTLLAAQPEKQLLRPGEVCFVRLRYVDEQGDVLPLARGILTVKVEGGELLGLGSACPYNEIGYCTDRTDTYYGEALAAVRAGDDGQVRLTVTDGTLQDTAVMTVS